MSDADAERSAKALQEISHHMRELVKVHKVLNENLAIFIRDAREFASEFSGITLVDEAQMTLDHMRRASEAIHEQQKARRETDVDPSGMVVGPDGKARLPFHEEYKRAHGDSAEFVPIDPLRDVQEPDNILSFNPNDRVWVPDQEEYGTVTVVGVEDQGKLFVEVELDNNLKVLCAPQVLTKVEPL